MKLIFLFTILFILQNTIQPIVASTTPKPYNDYITSSCSTTTYPSLCNQCLLSYASKVQNDSLRLCNAALKVSIQYAKNASNTVSAYSKQKGISSRDAGVIKDCIENIKDSVSELKQSVKTMASISNSTDKKFQLSSIKTYASAAITDEDTCVDELGDSKVSASVKKKIEDVIVRFEQTTSNALSLINRLNF